MVFAFRFIPANWKLNQYLEDFGNGYIPLNSTVEKRPVTTSKMKVAWLENLK